MPTYQYACTTCEQELEAVQKFTDDALTDCPQCTGRLRKVFSAVGVVFKGSGFYRNDSRPSESAKSESAKTGAASGSSSNGSSDSTSSSKESSSSSPSSTSSPKKETSSSSPAKSGGRESAA